MSACQYPHLSSMTAYRLGCRCLVCKHQRRADEKRWDKNRAAQCFEGGLSQSVIDEWAARVWETWTEKERRIVREVL